MEIPPEKWEAVKALFEAAVELTPVELSDFLHKNCQDPNLRAEVERLLREHRSAGSFLSRPALDSFYASQDRGTRFQPEELIAGRFKIIRFIGAGGMGEVYEAQDLELRERVAIKTICPEILQHANAVDRLRREVRLARKVTHPNVCRINDLFWHKPESSHPSEEAVLISMELLRGETLSERLRECESMPVNVALPIVKQLVSGLGAAHAAGIVHRDFKPGNVMLIASDAGVGLRAVVTDFGLAHQPANLTGGPSATARGELWGSPAYMAPEQIEGRGATIASDIYAVGLVIYEMVTGRQPFEGDAPISVAAKRLSQAARSPRDFRPELPPRWEAVILRCLEREPTMRFTSAQRIADALSEEDESVPVSSTVVSTVEQPKVAVSDRTKTSKSTLVWIWAGLAILVFVGVITVFLLYRPPPVGDGKRGAGSEDLKTSTEQDGDRSYWQGINQTDPKELELYLQKYPNGEYADLARVRLKKLVGASGSQSAINHTSRETQTVTGPITGQQPTVGRRENLQVLGGQPWTDTGIDLNVPDTVSVNASGNIRFSAEIPAVGPTGDQPSCTLSPNPHVPYVAPELRCHSLIGRIGLSGTIFEVGSSRRFRAPAAGRLYLGVNDNFFPDNSGSWTAEITLGPGDQPADDLVFVPGDQPADGLVFVPVFVSDNRSLAPGFSAKGKFSLAADRIVLDAGGTASFSFKVSNGQTLTVAFGTPTEGLVNTVSTEVSVNDQAIATIEGVANGLYVKSPTRRLLWRNSFGPGNYVVSFRSGGWGINFYGLWLSKPARPNP